MTEKQKPINHLVWLDLEMTGLNPAVDEILEMAIVITNKQLEVVAESENWVFSCPQEKLESMDDWNQGTHSKSGLLDDVKNSSLTYAECEPLALSFIKEFVSIHESPMCGNTIYQDRRFLLKHMEKFHDYFHYRNLDVSSFKIACNLWLDKGHAINKAKTDTKHRAKSDIYESIEELRYYRAILFNA